MSNRDTTQPNSSQPVIYQIRVTGHLDSRWTGWFEGLTITLEENGDTLLTGPLVDQSALHGLLKKVRDLGLPLIAVCPIEHDLADGKNVRNEKGASGSFAPDQPEVGEKNEFNQ